VSGSRTIALQAGRQSDTLSQKKKKKRELKCFWQILRGQLETQLEEGTVLKQTC
jgi:hypothetical protein